MKIVIIGWYGTETIGDRAILAGLLNVMSDVFPSLSIRVGSLYPVLTERTLLEDEEFYQELANGKLEEISVFDSRSPWQLSRHIKNSDLLIVGGGPLMDIAEMGMLEYAFTKARSCHIRSLLLGCGWGPLTKKTMIHTALNLVKMAVGCVFRDSTSLEQCRAYGDYGHAVASIDPAFFACHHFMQTIACPRLEDHISINFRDVAVEGTHYATKAVGNELFSNIVRSIVAQTGLQIYLVPMHYFEIGGDDRIMLQKIAEEVGASNVSVIHNPLSLKQTMEMYYNSRICVGMRFHSIVLQTMLNGNNYIIDYTDPLTGKIANMLRQLQIKDWYANRYLPLYSDKTDWKVSVNAINRFTYDTIALNRWKKIYVDILRQL